MRRRLVVGLGLLLVVGVGLALLTPAKRDKVSETGPQDRAGSASAIDLLIERLQDRDASTRANAVAKLVEMGPTAIPAISDSLTNASARVRREAVIALHAMGLESTSAIPALCAALEDSDMDVRLRSASALGNLGPLAESAVPALSVALTDDAQPVRLRAAEALSKIGRAATAALPALGNALEDDDLEVRWNTIYLLRQWDEVGAQWLGKALKDENLEIRIAAAEALVRLGPRAKGAVVALSEALQDENAYVRERAALALQRVGPEAQAATPSSVDKVPLIAATDPPPRPSQPPARIPNVQFTDITEAAGIRFRHIDGAFGKKLLPETMGSGLAFIDYDNDGRQDVVFINSCHWPGHEDPQQSAPTMALYRNQGDGTFADVTTGSGLTVTMYGMGVTVGDYDNDGWPDLFVTGVGGNRLFRNVRANHGGRCFRDVTREAAVGGRGGWPSELNGEFLHREAPLSFASSAAFLDYDGDARLDLFVCEYITWSPALDLSSDYKPGGSRTYAPPRSFTGAQCRLYRNVGSGQFRDVSAEAGILVSNPDGQPVGKALGVVVCDADDDGWPDIIVANDGVRNFLFHNEGDDQGARHFVEIGVISGVAYAGEGYARAGMGIDWGEYRPGCYAILIGNYADEPNTFLRLDNRQQLLFSDVTAREGIANPSRDVLKFGVFFFDYDLDGRQDLLTCNGHLAEEISQLPSERSGQSYRQPVQLFWNTGGAPCYVLVGAEQVGPDLLRPLVGRGCAYADIDGDGYLDVGLTQTNGPARLLRNEGGTRHNWLRLVLEGDGENSNRSAIGAQVTVEAGGLVQRREVTSGRGYLSQSELPLTFGLNQAERVDRVTIQWPGRNAVKQHLTDLEINRQHVIRQPDPMTGEPAEYARRSHASCGL